MFTLSHVTQASWTTCVKVQNHHKQQQLSISGCNHVAVDHMPLSPPVGLRPPVPPLQAGKRPSGSRFVAERGVCSSGCGLIHLVWIQHRETQQFLFLNYLNQKINSGRPGKSFFIRSSTTTSCAEPGGPSQGTRQPTQEMSLFAVFNY